MDDQDLARLLNSSQTPEEALALMQAIKDAEDPLRTARGMANGAVIGIVFWAALAGLLGGCGYLFLHRGG